MKAQLRLLTTAAFLILSGTALGQTDPHHFDAKEAPATATPTPEGAMGDMQAQCAAMMPMMQK